MTTSLKSSSRSSTVFYVVMKIPLFITIKFALNFTHLSRTTDTALVLTFDVVRTSIRSFSMAS